MVDISVSGLTRQLGERVLFKDIRFGLQQGQRVGLIARNGAGKTSLMNILAGIDKPDAGEVSLRRDVRVGYLPQQPKLDANLTVLQVVLQAETEAQKAVAAYEIAMPLAEKNPEDASAQRALQAALAELERLNAWDYEAEVKAVLERLQIVNLHQPYGQLSGGQQRRVALARVLLQRPDIFLLDEPTNHLDLDMVAWLEGFLISRQATLLLVTHDRYFLDALCSEIYELADGTLYHYKGSYADFVEAKAARETSAAASVDKAKNLLRKEAEWMRRQPKARGTKSQARIDSFYDLQARAQAPVEGPKLALELNMARMGSQVLEARNLTKRHGEKLVLKDWSYVFRRGERVGLVGPNGTGKTTLLDLLTGRQQPDSGSVVVGETIKFGYYKQTGLTFLPGQRVIDVVKAIAEVIPIGKDEELTAEQFLRRFQFEPARQYTPVELLSGGERRRLHLLTVLVSQPNFLILDEPTNDLDIPTLQALEDFLQGYQGCLVVVTHDRYFLDRLVEHMFIFEGDGVLRDWNGNYTDYCTWRDERVLEGKTPAGIPSKSKDNTSSQSVSNATGSAPARKLTFKEQKELNQLEQEIALMEARQTELTAQMQSSDHTTVTTAAAAYQSLQNELDAKTLRWLKLSES